MVDSHLGSIGGRCEEAAEGALWGVVVVLVTASGGDGVVEKVRRLDVEWGEELWRVSRRCRHLCWAARLMLMASGRFRATARCN